MNTSSQNYVDFSESCQGHYCQPSSLGEEVIALAAEKMEDRSVLCPSILNFIREKLPEQTENLICGSRQSWRLNANANTDANPLAGCS